MGKVSLCYMPVSLSLQERTIRGGLLLFLREREEMGPLPLRRELGPLPLREWRAEKSQGRWGAALRPGI